jgi:hypothetical protein
LALILVAVSVHYMTSGDLATPARRLELLKVMVIALAGTVAVFWLLLVSIVTNFRRSVMVAIVGARVGASGWCILVALAASDGSGLDHEKLTYRHTDCDYRMTDVYGNVVKGVIA